MTILSFLKYLRGIFNTTLKSKTVHHAIIQSVYDSFLMVDGDIDLMRLEMCLSTATGKWLDHWGEFFTVRRKLNETDDAYSRRIIEQVIRPKTTIPSMKDYIAEFLNDKYGTSYTAEDVDIREPWTELAKYSHKGTLSNTSRFFSKDYYCHSTIDISVPEALTQDLIDLVMAIKAAGVKVVWSFLNSYDIVTGFHEANGAWANYVRHLLTEAKRFTYSGLILSHTSLYPTLSGRREIWFEIQSLYCWYAKMLDKDTDKSILITKKDLSVLLDYYEQIEQIFYTEDTGLKISVDGVLSNLKTISGSATETEMVTRLITITEKMMESLQLVDDWLTLSYKGKLSTSSGEMFNFEASHALLSKILDTIEKFKQENRDYYNALQPPILMGEQAQYLVPRHNNWLFSTPTMSQQDFYDFWEMGDEDDNLQKIYDYEQVSEKKYLTFGDVYQPPIVIAGSPWDWTPIIDSPWLWKSATLTNEELEEIYRMKFSGWPDLVDVTTTVTTHPENNFTLSSRGKLSEFKLYMVDELVHSSELSLRLSSDGILDSDKVVSGEAVQSIRVQKENPDYTGITYLSGDESTITKHYTVHESMPTLGKLIEFEENQDIFNPNEKITYSTRDWMQAPVQIGEYAQWLIAAHTRQLWDTIAIFNDEIMSFWDEADKSDEMIQKYVNSSITYQPPIVITDGPFYWTNRHDIPWLWASATLNREELEEVYREKLSEHAELFPDLVTTTTIRQTLPELAFRLSDNGKMPDNHLQEHIQETKHLENGFVLSQNSVISNRQTEYRTTTETIPHPENSFKLSANGAISAHPYDMQIVTINHTENNFVLSSSPLNSHQISGGDIEHKPVYTPNPRFDGYKKLSGEEPEIIKTVTPVTYKQLPLKFMSGDKTDIVTTYSVVLDEEGSTRYLSGNKSTYKEQSEVDEQAVILGTLIEWEEKQTEVLYSTRYVLQAPILIGDYVQWLVAPNTTQLWNSPTIPNSEIRWYWEGEGLPSTMIRFRNLLLADPVRYQPPFERADKPFRWTIPVQENQLWNSPVMSNEEILQLWVGSGRPANTQKLEPLMQPQQWRYEPPIVVYENQGATGVYRDIPWLWNSATLNLDDLEELYSTRQITGNLQHVMFMEEQNTVPYSPRGTLQAPIQITPLYNSPIVVKVDEHKLWNTPILSNKDILSFWEGDNPPTALTYRKQYLNQAPSYTLPITFTEGLGLGGTIADTTWLWNSQTLNQEDLEALYSLRLFTDNPTLGQLINHESGQASSRGNAQAPVQIT